MNIKVSRRTVPRPGGRFAALIAFLATVCIPLAYASEPLGGDPDCGVNSLYLLCRIEGRPVELAQLARALPTRDPKGFSMLELSRAAGTAGLPLDGIEIRADEASLDRTGIAYLRDSDNGHFIIVRPVGIMGGMVQVIDPPNPPLVMEYRKLSSLKSWTGHMLVPRTSRLSQYIWPLSTGMTGVIFLITWVQRRRGKRGQGEWH